MPEALVAAASPLFQVAEMSGELAVVGMLGPPGRRRHTGGMRLEIYVRPNAARTVVGGAYNGALVVRVAEPAEHGRATAAALAALADALSVPRGLVTLVRGTASRRKLVEVAVDEREERAVDDLVVRLRGL